MTRLGAVFWLVLVLAAGFTTFKVKYAIQDTEDQLNRVRRHTVAEQQEIRVLTAEWTYLNQPERLSDLNRRFLGLNAITTRQRQRTIDEIPLRVPPARSEALAEASPDPAERQEPATPRPAAPAVVASAPAAGLEIHRGKPPEADRAHPLADPAPPRAATHAPMQLANAGPVETANSLDALIARIVETR